MNVYLGRSILIVLFAVLFAFFNLANAEMVLGAAIGVVMVSMFDNFIVDDLEELKKC